MSRPRIFVLTPDISEPTGGVKVLYRHVDILNAHGFDAAIMHEHTGFRCSWFEHATKVVWARQTPVASEDIIVLPEIFGPQMLDFVPGTRKVVYNQSGSLTFQSYPIDASEDACTYLHPDVVATFCISENVERYMAFAFPKMPLYRMHWSLDPNVYTYIGAYKKKEQICFMPRRHPEDAQQVFNMLKFRGGLRGFGIVPIHNMSAQQAARVMGESMLFFSFGYPEGLPLPPAEAMARGCIVVGYHGWGGREYFRPEFSYPIDAGEILDYVETAEHVLEACARGDKDVLEKGRAASKYIHEHYSRRVEEDDVVRAWTAIAGPPE